MMRETIPIDKVLEALRGTECEQLVAKRIESFTKDREATEPWLHQHEARNLAYLILHDLTTPRFVFAPPPPPEA